MALDNSIDSSIVDYIESMSMDAETTLKSIDLTLKAIARSDGLIISQSSLQDLARQSETEAAAARRRPKPASQQGSPNNGKPNAYQRGSERFDTNDMRRRGKISAQRFFDELTDSMEEAFTEELFDHAHPFQDALRGPLNDFAQSLGTDIRGLSKEVGKRLGQQVGNAFKNSQLGAQLQSEWQNIGNYLSQQGVNFLGRAGDLLNDPNTLSNIINGSQSETSENNQGSNFRDMFNRARDMWNRAGNSGANASDLAGEGMQGVENVIGDVAPELGEASEAAAQLAETTGGLAGAAGETTTALSTVASGSLEAGAGVAAMGGEAGAVALAFPEVTVALIAGAIALEMFADCFGPAIDACKRFGESLSSSANRFQSQNSKNLELYRERIKADIESMATAPFEILKDAANKALDAWDNVVTTITATQGYDKAGLQELYSNYASRLKDEGLASVVSSADMMSNLKSVIEGGLSGAAAEEFAYMATVLGKAIPTEDFFAYADTYASITANAIKNGKSQDEAISEANSQLEAFASNILYASRQISGGMSTSLKNASSLFEDAAKIAYTSRTGDIKEISGVLTSVSALVGSIAPDLANEMVSSVVKAATGGNSSEITALRSLTSAGASNTAFLRALAEDPQKLFTELFTNLAKMQGMSSDNYMEVAETLSSVFGISMDAFARVDFQYLAQAISKMNVNNDTLQENLELLSSGQTTQTAEQMRIQKINEYMIEEGLSYVLDNEVARSVQEHMWQEQMMREIEKNQFAVELQGAALDLLSGVYETIQNILNFLNPAAWVSKVATVALTAIESASLSEDIAKIIDSGKVGSGNAVAYDNLLSGNRNLRLVDSYIDLMGLDSATDAIRGAMQLNNLLTGNVLQQGAMAYAGMDHTLSGAIGKASALFGASNAGNRYYKWGTITKAAASAASSGDWRTDAGFSAIWNANQAIAEVSQQKVQEFLDTMATYTADMAAATASGSSSTRSIANARESAQNRYLTQKELEDLVLNADIEEPEMSFDEWVNSASGYGIANLGQILTDYGLTMTDIQSKFQQYQTQATAKAEHARQLHEVQFWENVEEYNNNYFPNHFENEFLRNEWMLNWEMMYMTPIRDDLHQLLTDWEDYYIHHTAYTDATSSAFEDAINLANQEKDQTGDSVLALAKALTENSNWLQENQELLKDPVVHANVLLSQILVVTEAIMQQNNNAGTNAIPTSLLSMGTGGNY